MRKKILLIPLALLLIASLVACAAPAPAPAPTPAPAPAPAPAPPPTPAPPPELPIVKWVLYNWTPPTTYHGRMTAKLLIENISDRTNGKFQIRDFYRDTLGFGQDEIHSALSNEVVDIANISLGGAAGALPWCGIFGRPFLCSWPDEFYQLSEAVFPVYEREFAKMGITPVKEGFSIEYPQLLWTIDPVEDITDLGGMKVRVWDEATGNAAEAVGATPVLLASTEVYLALQLGTMEGLFTGVSGVTSGSYYEIVKHGYLLGVSVPAHYLTYNNDAYERLPNEYKTILLEEIENVCKLYRDGLREDYEKEIATVIAKGVQLHEVSNEDSRVIAGRLTPNWQKWADAGGPVARELLDIALETLGY